MYQALTHFTFTIILNKYYYPHLIVRKAKILINGITYTQVPLKGESGIKSRCVWL